MIHNVLFSDNIVKGSVVGPLRIEEDNHIVVKVMGWTDQKLLSENARKQRWQDVKDKLTEAKAVKIYLSTRSANRL